MAARIRQEYRPLYFLSALGAGGMSVGVFMYLMYLVPHKGLPIPTYESIAAVYANGSPLAQGLVTTALIIIGLLALLHIVLMVVNVAAHLAFVRTDAYLALRRSNAEVTLMAIPLTWGMTINVSFILGALAVPGLWSQVEYLFPVALAALGVAGYFALRIFGRYIARILGHSGFDIEDNNHFSQMLPSFTFAMFSVGFASSAGMSHVTWTVMAGIFGSTFFAVASLLWALVKLPVSFGSMLRKGMAVEAGPTLWIGIPVLTMLSIAFIRVSHGIAETFFHTELPPAIAFTELTLALSSQVLMGMVGLRVMRKQGYFTTFVWGKKRSAASLGLVCPGVAISVIGMFFIGWGLVKTGLVVPFSTVHLTLLGMVGAVQIVFLAIMLRLTVKLLLPASVETKQLEKEPEEVSV
jgi:hypothetical protein